MLLPNRVDRLARTRRRTARPVRLHLEAMEDRTVPAQAVAVGPDLMLQGPGPNTAAKIGDSLYFLARQDNAGPTGANIWHVSGSAQADPLDAPALAGQAVVEIAIVGDTLYATAYAPPTRGNPATTPGDINVWKIDAAAPGGAVKLTDFHSAGAGTLHAVGDKLVFQHSTFITMNPPAGADLWVSDGTAAGTKQIANFDGYLDLSTAAVAGDDLYFSVHAISSPTSASLWVTDGTDEGTHSVASFGHGEGQPYAALFDLTAAGDTVFFAGRETDFWSPQLWKAKDGRASLVRTFDTDPQSAISSSVSSLTAVGDDIYFAINGPQGGEVWKSGGNLTAVYQPVGGGSTPQVADIAVLDGTVYFTTLGVTGELFKVDNASKATPLALPGVAGLLQPLTVESGRIYFMGNDAVHGTEMWVTDGATATRLGDISPGPGSSYPLGPVEAGGSLYAMASDGVLTGSGPFTVPRLWKLPDADAPAGAVTTTTIKTSATTAAIGGKVTVTATVTAADPSKPAPTGSVVFRDNGMGFGIGYGRALLVNGVAKFDVTISAPGAHDLQAVYTGDDTFDESVSAPVTVTVAQAATSVSLGTSVTTVAPGQPVTLTATVAPVQPTAQLLSGTVTFLDGGKFLGTGFVIGGMASMQTSSLSAGPHAIMASYSGDMWFSGSQSGGVNVTVQKTATTASLRSTAPTARVGQSLTFTATIATASSPAPTGTVTFKDGTKTLGTVPVGNGKAVFAASNLAVGAHAISAVYSGDGKYAGSSAGMTQTVTAAGVATATTLNADDADLTTGERLVLRAAVKPGEGAATPTGSVTFRDGNAVLGAAVLDRNGETVFLVDKLGTGSHSITATFGGVGIYGASSSAPLAVTVRLASSTAMTSSAASLVSGQGVTLTAAVAAAGLGMQPAGSVTFYDGSTAVGTAAIQNGVAKFSTGPLSAVGIHRLAAKYNGNALFAGSSSAVSYVNVRTVGTATTLQPPSAPVPGTGLVTLSAAVAAVAPATGSPTGKVTFLDGNTKLGSATVVGGKASLQVPKLAAGSHFLRAAFEATGGYAGSTSAIVRYTVAATTSTTLDVTPAAFGQTAALKATVTVLSPGFGKASGKVTFRDGSTVLGSATLLNGVATLGAKLATGTHSLTATYEGTGDYAGSTSAAVGYMVQKAVPALSLMALPPKPSASAKVGIRYDVGPATSGAAKPTGSITIQDGANVLGTFPVANGPMVLQGSKLTVGTHAFKATYAGDANYLAATADLSVTVG